MNFVFEATVFDDFHDISSVKLRIFSITLIKSIFHFARNKFRRPSLSLEIILIACGDSESRKILRLETRAHAVRLRI